MPALLFYLEIYIMKVLLHLKVFQLQTQLHLVIQVLK